MSAGQRTVFLQVLPDVEIRAVAAVVGMRCEEMGSQGVAN